MSLYGICIYVDVPSILSSLHHDRPTAFTFQSGIVNRRIDAAHNSVSTDADTHPISDHERDAAEHPLLLDIDAAVKSSSHTI
ncbi:MAG TPA: hypothetical protein VH477_16685 [Bryobacteraceae bacterium]